MNNKTTQFLICFSGLTSLNTFADHPTVAFGDDGSGPINTISATPAEKGAWGFGLRTEVLNNDEFSTEQLEAFASQGLEGVHSLDRITNTSFSLSYGLTSDLTLSARLPYIERKNIREGEIEDGEAEAHVHGDSAGLGDLLLLSQYRLMQRDDTDIAIHLGVKAPTGETNEKDDDDVKFETEFQPGSGSWDLLLGAAISTQHRRFGYHANILYNYTTEGSQDTEIGDVFSYNAALSYRLNDHDHAGHDHGTDHTDVNWDLLLELNGETRQKNEIAGESEDHSGGTIVYLSPGARLSMGRFSGFLSLGFPIVEDQNGKQTDIETRIVAGISLAL